MLINFLGFSIQKGIYVQLVVKVVATWLILHDAHIPLMYITLFWIIYLRYIYIFMNLIIL